MSSGLDSDALIALRRLRRHLTWWRLLAVIGFALALFVSIQDSDVFPREAHVARIEIEGVIVEDKAFLAMLDTLARDKDVRAVIVDISSPGGTFTGGDALYRALRRIGADKPVVTVMGAMATSGAYMAAIAADRIYAGYGTITGSIGVIMQSADVTGLLDKLGVKPEIIKSGAVKASPNPTEPLSGAAREQLQGVIDVLHRRFMEMVAERRGMSIDAVRASTGDGRIMVGTDALKAGLIDAIGDVNTARAWLAQERGISADLPLLEWAPDEPLAWWREQVSSLAAAIFGNFLLPERLRLDGIQALWHPSLSGGR
ncbi:MAG: signal peptide peptidase SppA [Rhodospirillales bacterium]